jgi:hypothetical protein
MTSKRTFVARPAMGELVLSGILTYADFHQKFPRQNGA